MPEKPVIFVCGASARQVVSIATSAQIICYAADLFNDYETRCFTDKSVKVERLEDVHGVANAFNYDHCVLAGGMENYPDIVEAICPVLPCRDRDSLLRCRDPIALLVLVNESNELSNLNIKFPLTTRERPENAVDGEWLIKRTDRSGGLGVQRLTSTICNRKANQVYQRSVHGDLVSGLFIADGHQASLLGISQQWAGRSELGCQEFSYCGSIAPYVVSQSQYHAVRVTGEFLTSEFGLRGIFGIDFVLDNDNLWLLEINPRITASAEVCGRLIPLNIVEEHVRAMADVEFNAGQIPPYPNPASPTDFHGKAIVFNRETHSVLISADLHRQLRKWTEQGISPSQTVSSLVDLPMPDTPIGPGSPVLTIRVSAQKKSAVETRLLQLAEEVYQMINVSNSLVCDLRAN